jgi:hypothetical protein
LMLVEEVEALSGSRLVAVSKLLAVEFSVSDVLFDSDLSVVDAVAGDVLFGSDSLLSVVSDDKGVGCSSGFEVVSAVGTTVVSLLAFSLVVSAVTASNFWLFSCSDWETATAGNCVVFSGKLSLAAVVAAVVLFSSELLINESISGVFIAGLLKSELGLFEKIRLGLIRGSSKAEPSLPIRGSTSKLDESLGALLVITWLVLAEDMLLISGALLIIKASALARLNPSFGWLAVSIKLRCSEFPDSPEVWYNKVLLVLISGRIECFVGATPGIKDSSSSVKGSPIGSVKGTVSTPDFRVR